MKRKSPIYLVAQRPLNRGELGVLPPPLGLLYVAQALRNAGYPVRIFHLGGDDRLKTIQDAVRDERPLFVGFSNFLQPELKFSIEISRWLHSQGVKVVWGGIFSTALPGATVESGFVDYAVIGEGEISAPLLARAIEEGELPKGVPGVAFKHGEEVVFGPPAPLTEDLDSFGMAWDLLDMENYLTKDPATGLVMTGLPLSRGCPFKCKFCYNAMDPSRRVWRAHSPEFMKELADYLNKHYGVNAAIFLCDHVFGKIKPAQEVIARMGISWWAPTHLSVVSPEFLDFCLETRCMNLGFGLESGSDRVLKLMNKPFTSEEIRNKLALCREKGVHTSSSWILLYPGETREDFQKTVHLLEEIHRSEPTHGFGINICRAYPETPLWQVRKEHGLPDPQTLEEWADCKLETNFASGYSDRQTRRLHLLAVLLYPKDRLRYDNRIPRQLRPLLLKRLLRARFNFPLEETMRIAWRIMKR